MGHCRFCQAELEEDAERCALCGQPRDTGESTDQTLPSVKPEPTLARCLVCGKEQPAWSLFCRECGQPLKAQEEAAAPALSSEVVLMPAVGEGQVAEEGMEAEAPVTLVGGAGLPGMFSEFSDAYWARLPGTQAGFPPRLPPWPGAPAFPQPTIKRRSLRAALRKRLTPRVIAVVVAVIVVLTGLGAGAYLFTRPHPVIQVTINQHSGSTLDGSPDTDLYVNGHDFSPDSTVVFLLDGAEAPGAPRVTSEHDGSIAAILTITDDWSFSTHTLTASDAQGYTTHDGVTVRVLPQPVVTLTSRYNIGSTPAGATGTTFEVRGKRFTPRAAVTILLDGKPLTLAQPLTSDARGQISASLLVTADWALGGHALTAQDDKGYVTRQIAALVILRQEDVGALTRRCVSASSWPLAVVRAQKSLESAN